MTTFEIIGELSSPAECVGRVLNGPMVSRTDGVREVLGFRTTSSVQFDL